MPLQSPIAPSVIIARKHSSPISSTARDGSAEPLPSSECADALPSRAVTASAKNHSATPTIRLSTRGSSPAAPTTAPSPEATTPPTLQPPCSEDMIGLGSSRSTATACAFIDTSMAPLTAPKTNRIAPSIGALEASSGSGSIRQKSNAAARVTEPEERRSRIWPVSGIDTSAPAAMHSRQSPIVAFDTLRWSCSHGMCATQEPIIAPLTAKTRNVAARGVTMRPVWPRRGSEPPGEFPPKHASAQRESCDDHVDARLREGAREIRVAVGDEMVDVGQRRHDPRARGAQLVRRRERDHLARAGDHRPLDRRLLMIGRRHPDLGMQRADAEHADVRAHEAERVDRGGADG